MIVKTHSLKFHKHWFGPYKIQYFLPNNIMVFVTIDKFDHNLVLININKLKPYRFVEDQTLQRILIKPSFFTKRTSGGNSF